MTRRFNLTRSFVQNGDAGPILLQWYCDQAKLPLLPREAIMLGRHRAPLAPGWSAHSWVLRTEEVCQ